MPLGFIRDTLQPVCAVQGNLDNQVLVKGGKALDEAAARLLEALSGGPFIFNLGHGVHPETPYDSVVRLVEVVQSHKGTS